MKKFYFIIFFVFSLFLSHEVLAQVASIDGFRLENNYLSEDGKSAEIKWRLMGEADCSVEYSNDYDFSNLKRVWGNVSHVEDREYSYYEYSAVLSNLEGRIFYKVECTLGSAKVSTMVRELKKETSDLVINEKYNHHVQEGSTVIFWATNEEVDCYIDVFEPGDEKGRISYKGTLNRTAENSYDGKNEYSVSIPDLKAKTDYTYDIVCISDDEIVIKENQPIAQLNNPDLPATTEVGDELGDIVDIAIDNVLFDKAYTGDDILIRAYLENKGGNIYSVRALTDIEFQIKSIYGSEITLNILDAGVEKSYPFVHSPFLSGERVEVTWKVNFSLSGEYPLIFKIDKDNSFPEVSEENNIVEKSIFVFDKQEEEMLEYSIDNTEPVVKDEKIITERKFSNIEMYKKLKGKIVLKVEESGEAYYMNPVTEIAHYLGRPDDAFSVMRDQGIGVTNEDLYKIPVGINNNGVDTDGDGLSDYLESVLGLDVGNVDTDGDGFSDKEELSNGYNPIGSGKQNTDLGFSERQKGKILLQVQNKGEAWYVNPNDGRRYFLGRPDDAFAVMRNLGLGISNTDFDSMLE